MEHRGHCDRVRAESAGFNQCLAPGGTKEELGRVFPTLEKISVDYAIMEKAARVLVVEMPCDWLDVGSLTAVAEAFEPDGDGNTAVAPNAMFVDAKDNILIGEDDHLITAFGVRDLIIVHSSDATLVCRKQDAERLKDLVTRICDTHGTKYQ